ncbi:MAG: indole-3-glycerol phosphate synthase TrpC [Fusobacteria bacterium]|nr:indole-3-glycerol phosphate synthase TrpC [Fusobacteriota bacterium]
MILNDIVVKRREQLQREKEKISLAEIKQELEYNSGRSRFDLSGALKEKGFGIIAEVKKASPSLGVIKKNFTPLVIAKQYESAGAIAVSVLTEENYFMGLNGYLLEIASTVKIPVLRKDFIIDEYQIYHSSYLGASAILLIVAILEKEQLKKYLDLSNELGLDAIVEVHDSEELKIAIKAGAKIIGINNRNLKNFEVDIKNTEKLIKDIPEGILVISESGIKSLADIEYIKSLGVNGALVGEALMKSSDIEGQLKEWL